MTRTNIDRKITKRVPITPLDLAAVLAALPKRSDNAGTIQYLPGPRRYLLTRADGSVAVLADGDTLTMDGNFELEGTPLGRVVLTLSFRVPPRRRRQREPRMKRYL